MIGETTNPFRIFEQWLDWLVSHDGRLHRRARGEKETDMDVIALIPTPPGQSILTVGDLRALVAAGREWVAWTHTKGALS